MDTWVWEGGEEDKGRGFAVSFFTPNEWDKCNKDLHEEYCNLYNTHESPLSEPRKRKYSQLMLIFTKKAHSDLDRSKTEETTEFRPQFDTPQLGKAAVQVLNMEPRRSDTTRLMGQYPEDHLCPWM